MLLVLVYYMGCFLSLFLSNFGQIDKQMHEWSLTSIKYVYMYILHAQATAIMYNEYMLASHHLGRKVDRIWDEIHVQKMSKIFDCYIKIWFNLCKISIMC